MIFARQKKDYSIRKIFIRYFLLLLLFTSGGLLFYCGVLITGHFAQTTSSAEMVTEFYKSSLDNELEKCVLYEQKLCYSDPAFQMLTLSNLSDADKITYLSSVQWSLNRQVSSYEGIFIFNDDNSVSALAVGESFNDNNPYVYYFKEQLRYYWLGGNHAGYGRWIAYRGADYSMLMRAVKVRDILVCTVIKLDHIDFVDYSGTDLIDVRFGFFDQNGILSGALAAAETGLTTDMLLNPPGHIQFRDYYLLTAPVEGTDIRIFTVFRTEYMWSVTTALITAFIALSVTTCIVIVFVFRSMNRILLYPVEQTASAMRHLEEGSPSDFRNKNRSNVTEFQNIDNALADLMEQKFALDLEKQQEAFEKDHAKLQYYQLQTRSHFMANCLKSLYAMLISRQYEKMQMMIIAFSNHLRYIFNDTLKLVPLKAEMEEVNDYYHIVLLDRTTPFILNTNIDPDLNDCSVPPLIIQTFLENTVKYNRQSDNLLIFDIQISRAELDGAEVMRILLSDNGTGYSDAMLERLNSSGNDLYATKHVGISNLKHRIALLYKSGYQFAFYNKPSGGACGLFYLPMVRRDGTDDS